MKPIAPNSMIQNRYLVVQMIGKGGMGEVYLAVDQRLGSAVALKRTMFAENEALGNAFEREAKILGRLRHPVLPKVIDHFIEGGEQYLIMEHISGDDLGKRMESAQKPFPLSWVMFWADQLLDALNYLHSHEPPIIHRDIKPENLKLTDDNHIVLLDFGLSKDFDSDSIKAQSLGTGSVVGYSPFYASMEQVRGTGTDARSDIYSLSATLYQFLSNKVPVDSLTRADAMLGGKADPIEPLYQANREVSPAISEVILKGIAVRQDERFATAAEMQKALRRAFNQSGTASENQKIIGDREASTAMMELPPEISGISQPTPQAEAPFVAGNTIEFNAASTDPAIIQADIKTQIFDNAALSEPVAVQPEPITPEVEPEPAPVVEVAPPVETAPVNAVPMAAAAAASASASPVPLHSQPEQQTAQPQKKSKGGKIIGGLVGMLVMAGIAAGGGWYAYNNYYLPSQVKESPTPTPETKVSPSPSPTESVVVADANTNGNSNANVGQTDNTNTSGSNSRVIVQTPPESRDTPPTGTKNPPAQSPKPPTAKTPPKAKGKDDRTVILQ